MGFQIASYSQAQEENMSSVAVKDRKRKKNPTRLEITGKGKENKISLSTMRVIFFLLFTWCIQLRAYLFQNEKTTGKGA